jgi:hypothetical protein
MRRRLRPRPISETDTRRSHAGLRDGKGWHLQKRFQEIYGLTLAESKPVTPDRHNETHERCTNRSSHRAARERQRRSRARAVAHTCRAQAAQFLCARPQAR